MREIIICILLVGGFLLAVLPLPAPAAIVGVVFIILAGVVAFIGMRRPLYRGH